MRKGTNQSPWGDAMEESTRDRCLDDLTKNVALGECQDWVRWSSRLRGGTLWYFRTYRPSARRRRDERLLPFGCVCVHARKGGGGPAARSVIERPSPISKAQWPRRELQTRRSMSPPAGDHGIAVGCTPGKGRDPTIELTGRCSWPPRDISERRSNSVRSRRLASKQWARSLGKGTWGRSGTLADWSTGWADWERSWNESDLPGEHRT